jgi:formate hydrogenlyase subunit 3/multisubunit Na+/H+ antiporter MnhD subunit
VNGTVSQLLLFAPAAPLLLALALVLFPKTSAPIAIAPWAALPALTAALIPMPFSALHYSWVLLGADLGLDGTGRVFLLFTALLWLVAGIYARAYLPSPASRKRFFVYFLLAMSGNLGLIVALDIMTYFAFFALMSFASYGLVVHDRTPEAIRAGRVYMMLVIVGEMLLFASMILVMRTSDSLVFDAVGPAVLQSETRNLILLLTLLGFGIKVGAFGLHMWLPLAHPVAPTPASAVLSGAMIKAGLLGWLRMLPLGDAALPLWGGAIVIAGLAAAFFGALVGLTQRNPKTVLAYSSISQMGLITIGVGLGLLAPQAWPLTLTAVLIYALHHGLAKGALFLGVGVAAVPPSVAWRRWLVGLGLLLPALALAGAPFTSGMLAKALLKAQVAFVPMPWGYWIKTLLPWTAVGTTLIMARFLYLTWPRSRATKSKELGIWGPWAALVAAATVVPWLIPREHTPDLWSAQQIGAVLWPVILGAGLAGIARWTVSRHTMKKLPELPPGDILVPIEAGARAALQLGRWFSLRWLPGKYGMLIAGLTGMYTRSTWEDALISGEAKFGRWVVGVTLFLLLGTAIAMFALG